MEKRNKILIGSPICHNKKYSLKEYFNFLSNVELDYDIMFSINGDNREEVPREILKYCGIGTEFYDNNFDKNKRVSTIIKEMKNNNKTDFVLNILRSREQIRRYAIDNGYKGVFWLDTDTIPYYADTIDKIVEIAELGNYLSLSGLYFYKETSVPIIIGVETNTNKTLSEIQLDIEKHKPIEILASGYGCVYHTGKAMETSFDEVSINTQISDDIGHCHSLHNRGIKRYYIPDFWCYHLGKASYGEKFKKMFNIEVDINGEKN